MEEGGVAFPEDVGTEDSGMSNIPSNTLKPPLVYSRTSELPSSQSASVGPQSLDRRDHMNASPASVTTVGEPSTSIYRMGETIAQTAPEVEQTPEGTQTLVPGVKPVSPREKLEAKMKCKMRGADRCDHLPELIAVAGHLLAGCSRASQLRFATTSGLSEAEKAPSQFACHSRNFFFSCCSQSSNFVTPSVTQVGSKNKMQRQEAAKSLKKMVPAAGVEPATY